MKRVIQGRECKAQVGDDCIAPDCLCPPLNGEQQLFLARRTRPFLDAHSIAMRPLSLILEEVYLQGMADAAQVLRGRDNEPLAVTGGPA